MPGLEAIAALLSIVASILVIGMIVRSSGQKSGKTPASNSSRRAESKPLQDPPPFVKALMFIGTIPFIGIFIGFLSENTPLLTISLLSFFVIGLIVTISEYIRTKM